MKDAASKRWLRIAEAFDTPATKRSDKQWAATHTGLCSAYKAYGGKSINPSTPVFGRTWLVYAWGFQGDRSGDSWRRDVALLFSVMTADERREIRLPD